jgi:hypothetical protein
MIRTGSYLHFTVSCETVQAACCGQVRRDVVAGETADDEDDRPTGPQASRGLLIKEASRERGKYG